MTYGTSHQDTTGSRAVEHKLVMRPPAWAGRSWQENVNKDAQDWQQGPMRPQLRSVVDSLRAGRLASAPQKAAGSKIRCKLNSTTGPGGPQHWTNGMRRNHTLFEGGCKWADIACFSTAAFSIIWLFRRRASSKARAHLGWNFGLLTIQAAILLSVGVERKALQVPINQS